MSSISSQITGNQKLIFPPFTTHLPAPVWFRVAEMPALSTYPMHSHLWGEFVYSFSGLVEVELANELLTSPTHYGIWLPPNVIHMGLNKNEATHCSFYIMPELCTNMPEQACTLQTSDFVISILEYLWKNPLTSPLGDNSMRLLRVLCDQLEQAPRQNSFLPMTQDPILTKIIKKMEHCPSDNTPLGALTSEFGASLRTLNRRSHDLLGISLNEWRQRMRVVKAIDMLEKGENVESVAFNVGYSSSSAFISMFVRITGQTPGSISTRLR